MNFVVKLNRLTLSTVVAFHCLSVGTQETMYPVFFFFFLAGDGYLRFSQHWLNVSAWVS